MRIAIAGGGTGLGAALALEWARAGAEVCVAARSAVDLAALQAAAPRPIATVACDLATDVGAALFAAEAFRVLGELDALIVCVGAAHRTVPLAQATRAVLLEQLEQNTIAATLAAGAVLRAWQARASQQPHDRQILFLSSLVMRRPPIPGTGPYAVAKAALEQVVRQLAEEAAPVRVNGLQLGAVATRLHRIAGTPEDAIARFPTPAQVAPWIVQLAGGAGAGPSFAGRTGCLFDAEALGLDPIGALWGGGQLAFVDALHGEPGTDNEPPPEAEPGRRPSPRVRRALRESAAGLHHYPRDLGVLLERLAQLHEVPAACVLASGGGATELLERSLRALTVPGDEVVSPFPTFEVLSALCSRLGLRHRPVPVARQADGLFVPPSARPLLAALGPRTRVVYVATPDNPTGATFPPAELRALLQGLPAGVALLLDEAWSLELPGPLPEGAPGPIRLRSFSKLFGLAGLRIGYALAPPPLASLLRKLDLPYPLGAPQLAAALAVLDELPRARKAALLLARERARTAEALRALGLLVSEGDSPVLLVRDPAGRNAGRLAFALRAAGLAVQEAHWDPAAVVIALGPPAQNRRLVAALRRALDRPP